MKLHIPGLPPIVQRAFDTLLNRGIGRDNLSNDVLACMIVESGSNANGEYVRWGNGFQVCWRYFGWPTSGGTIWWYDIYNWTYPVMFKERPNVHVVHGYPFSPREIGCYNSGLRTVTTTTAELVLVELGDYGESTLSGYVEAKGWWK